MKNVTNEAPGLNELCSDCGVPLLPGASEIDMQALEADFKAMGMFGPEEVTDETLHAMFADELRKMTEADCFRCAVSSKGETVFNDGHGVTRWAEPRTTGYRLFDWLVCDPRDDREFGVCNYLPASGLVAGIVAKLANAFQDEGNTAGVIELTAAELQALRDRELPALPRVTSRVHVPQWGNAAR